MRFPWDKERPKLEPPTPIDRVLEEPATPPWNYRPTGPFLLVANQIEGITLAPLSRHYFEDFDEAVKWFVRFHVGPMERRSVGIVDDYNQIMLGYHARAAEAEWFGTAIGFERLSFHHDAMTVGVWEAMAMGDRHPEQVPRDVVP